jgi:hypothetical protein
LVLDDDRLAERLRQAFADLPRDQVDTAAGLDRRDDLDRFIGVRTLRKRNKRSEARRCNDAGAREARLLQHEEILHSVVDPRITA